MNFWQKKRKQGVKVEQRIIDDIKKRMPKSIRNTMNDMAFARMYNNLTGANITHWDVRELGLNEETVISLAMDMLTGSKDKK